MSTIVTLNLYAYVNLEISKIIVGVEYKNNLAGRWTKCRGLFSIGGTCKASDMISAQPRKKEIRTENKEVKLIVVLLRLYHICHYKRFFPALVVLFKYFLHQIQNPGTISSMAPLNGHSQK